ncbi:MAG: SDR family oxidoreductase [Verrucomicrobiota bacterium]
MKIFLTGASGFVGSAFAEAAHRRGHRVVGVVGQATHSVPGLAQQLALDLTDSAALTSALFEHFPDAIVNCAAVAEPAKCDADPVRSEALNVALPTQLARLANHLSTRLVHLSTEQVFDGTAAPYAMDSRPNPVNLYGRQKLLSERAVHAAAPAFAVTVRPPLLTGNSLAGRRSLHERLFSEWAAGRTPRLYRDEIRQPCTAGSLAEVVVELCERTAVRGVVHWAGTEPLTRDELACRIRAHFKLTEKSAPISVIARADTPAESALRPAILTLALQPLAGLLKTQPESFEAQLDQFVIPPPCREWYHAQ